MYQKAGIFGAELGANVAVLPAIETITTNQEIKQIGLVLLLRGVFYVIDKIFQKRKERIQKK